MKKKILALFLCLVLCFTMAFSVMFIVTHTHHVCTGEDCPICMEIQVCIHTFSAIGTAVAVLAVFFAFASVLSRTVSSVIRINVFDTPVSLKVKLTN